MAKNWLAELVVAAETDRLGLGNTKLTSEWVAEVAAAQGGAEWFEGYSPACRARFAASWLWVAVEDKLDVPAELLAWTRSLAREYREEPVLPSGTASQL